MKAIRCIADNPHQSICLHEDGSVQLHANGWTGCWEFTPQCLDALEDLIVTLNLLGAGKVGQPCKVCKRKK